MYPFRVSPTKPKAYQTLSETFTPLLSAVLSARGIETVQQAEEIVNPTRELAHSPLLLHEMEKGVARIHKAMETGEKIAVYGDYDVDGITSTALLTSFLRSKDADVIPYIPQRMGEGYGLNEIALEDLFRKGVRLVITVDCGVSGKEQVAFATTLGIDIIITDHHSCPQELPQAYAVINPRLEPYPFPKLAGVGVALKVAQALSPEEEWDQVFHQYCDLVAVGTVADVMPMEGENRYFVKEGLEKLNTNPNLGMYLLLEEMGANDRLVNTGTIGYNISPRINAAGRLDQTDIALDLLLTDDTEKGKIFAQQLCTLNTERQHIEGEIYRQCLAELEENPPHDMVFLANSTWHPGVVGIVASRLGEQYQMPAMMICCRDGIGKGSCRTFGNIDLYQLLTQSSDLLLGFGGHAQAAGFTVAEENIPALQQQFYEILSKRPPTQEQKLTTLDARATIPQLTLEEVEVLAMLEPTGAVCGRPSFLLEGAEVLGASLVGGGKHLRLRLSQQGKEINGIFFHYLGEPVYIGAILDVAFHLQANHFRGQSTPQLQIFSMTLAREIDGYFQRWKRGGHFNAEEKEILCPTVEEVSHLWDFLQKESLEFTSMVELFQEIEEKSGLPYYHCEICLAILRERSWVKITTQPLSIQLEGEKDPLANSLILAQLQG